jgi:biopolymer transport protein ExbD
VVQLLDLLRSVGGDRVALATLPASSGQAPSPNTVVPPIPGTPGLTPYPGTTPVNPYNPYGVPLNPSQPGQIPGGQGVNPTYPGNVPTPGAPVAPNR